MEQVLPAGRQGLWVVGRVQGQDNTSTLVWTKDGVAEQVLRASWQGLRGLAGYKDRMVQGPRAGHVCSTGLKQGQNGGRGPPSQRAATA